MAKSKYILDELDQKIIKLLFDDARYSNRKLAAKLEVTEGTIRGRIKRMEDENLLRFTVITNIENLETPRLSLMGVLVDQNQTQEVIDQLNNMPEVNAVIKLFGRFDVLAMGLFGNVNDAYHVAGNKIRTMEGVRHVETISVVDIVKYDNRMAKIVSRSDKR